MCSCLVLGDVATCLRVLNANSSSADLRGETGSEGKHSCVFPQKAWAQVLAELFFTACSLSKV